MSVCGNMYIAVVEEGLGVLMGFCLVGKCGSGIR